MGELLIILFVILKVIPSIEEEMERASLPLYCHWWCKSILQAFIHKLQNLGSYWNGRGEGLEFIKTSPMECLGKYMFSVCLWLHNLCYVFFAKLNLYSPHERLKQNKISQSLSPFVRSFVRSFIHSFRVCLTTGPEPLPKRVLYTERSSAFFNFQCSLVSLGLFNICLRLLPRLQAT